MKCSREAMFVVTVGDSHYWVACERHVQQVTALRRGVRVEQEIGIGTCSWEMSSVGDMMRVILGEKGWTQKKLAEISRVSQQSISGLIQGKKRLTPMTAVKLAAALGLCPLAMMGTQVDYALWEWEQANPGVADEVRARLSQESE